MRVLKFGGTSLANPERFMQAADIIEKAHLKDQAAGVLSAPAKITNHLVAIVDKAIAGESFETNLKEATEIFHNIINGLYAVNNNVDREGLLALVEAELTQIQGVASEAAKTKALPDNVAATIHCRGEKLSIAMMQAWFEAKGYDVTRIDPVEKLLAHGSYLESSVDIAESTKRVDANSIPKKNVVLMAGFTAGNENGELVLLGRNGSDYSAACLAACLKADCCEIWTDVDGVYTCDPRLVPEAICLESMSYQEAMELSYFGAKVIHPRTIGPLVPLNIPCLIKNTANPDAKGTLIDGNVATDGLKVKGITNLDNVAMFNVSGSGMQGMVGMAARVFSTMSKAGISVILITQSSSEYSISFCVPAKFAEKATACLNAEFAQELVNGDLDPIDMIRELSIISVVGDGMRTAKGVAARFFSSLAQANISIVAIAQGSSERSISAVVPMNKAIEAVKATHQGLFSNKKSIEVFLVGVGGVGGELIEQIKQQKDFLAKKDIEIRVCALANADKMLLNENGLNLDNWKSDLETATQPSDFDVLLSFIKLHHVVNPVFVDCTAAQSVANLYTRALKEGFHVVTPNKKANTGSYQYYQELRDAARQGQHKFLYETNVGAGLPVIENLQNLLAAGDEVEKFEGILSGSLSFIFGKLDEGLSLSEATLIAKEKGFTEPDPRDDLSGADVARKLLILARETGLALEFDDIEVEGVLPKGFSEGMSKEEFLKVLPQVDAEFAQRVQAAKAEGKVLRYVGSITGDKCRVAIEAVDENHPLYKVKDGENALAFLTRYYSPIPLLLRGYGAGTDVTAAGIFADILRTLQGGAN
ncbi:bifunctional aspartate kinase/homoserine dehydrogenase I [Actinobacillus equuli subsp. equuli]|uniref:Bifunctional aspartokinase/homoserine dehydrogenase n=1 Tax=Actinobacillus equuli subsp. equuli TaxID=202947 RepID=A0A9X4G381_ACTEU|nr:bifunctional aspartate kinase/homoserine dehydrogenase I [Actinobacillus equuli]MDE8034293.1 bifunctional aspartate kinase/homoserine dehydrogenase I [Actinobacillus equuli subsp. equuli]MDG4947977.1 bifunctional aspartate kinase/homoserine dehydrogenase I [Actinobacillus equuli subsp. haemolyticus]WGE42495.1 bifunctional aspartate kinase/homoserine dehydrogenase I [Actinobacillus equuli subsp. haemolyticus]WGE55323.1 bifunctional aspartate kinase/homoserine dehydrogenase I [Actinobacillus e